ncbi:hypothetical protein SAVIM40S_02802 [Streptomyces avidinii]
MGRALPWLERRATADLGRLFRILSAEPAASGAVPGKAEGRPRTGRTRAPRQCSRGRCRAPRARQDPKEQA